MSIVSSINNSFIATVDHLPCDVIRSLWLVQSINICIRKHREELNQILQNIQAGSTPDFDRIVALKSAILHYSTEAIQESQALNNQLLTHKLCLNEELDQLQQIANSKINQEEENLAEQDVLRKQLEQHYKENPLISQKEAQREYSKQSKKKASVPSGIKLVLKLPKPKIKKEAKRPIHKKLKERRPRKEKVVVEVPVEESFPVEPAEDTNKYCFCGQGSFGDMIACDNEESCPNGVWFHYKCVGLLNRVEALKFTTGKLKWFCSEMCRETVEHKMAVGKEKKSKKRRRRW